MDEIGVGLVGRGHEFAELGERLERVRFGGSEIVLLSGEAGIGKQSPPPGARLARHRRIADRLRAIGASPIEQARHLEVSARRGDTEAIAVLESAARSVVAHAPQSAVRWLTAANTLVTSIDGPDLRLRVLDRLGAARSAMGDFEGGLRALEHSLAIVPVGDRPTRARIAIVCVDAERLLGSPDQAAARLLHHLAEFGSKPDLEAVRLQVALSTNAMYLGDFEAMLRWAGEAERGAVHLGDDALVVAARIAKISGAAFSGHVGEALDLHAGVASLMDSLPDDRVIQDLGALCGLGGAEMYLDLYRDAVAHASRGLDLARSSGQSSIMPYLSPIFGTCSWMIGEVDQSAAVLDDAIDAARLVDDGPSLAWHLFNRALGALMAGDVSTAFSLSSESFDLVSTSDVGAMLSTMSGVVYAHVLNEMGRLAESTSILLQSAGGAELPAIPGGWRAIHLELLTRSHLSLGNLSLAREAARDPLPGSGRVRTSRARPPCVPAEPFRTGCVGNRILDGPRAGGRQTHPGPVHKSRHRRRAVPQRQDRRNPRPPHLQQTRCDVAGRSCPDARRGSVSDARSVEIGSVLLRRAG